MTPEELRERALQVASGDRRGENELVSHLWERVENFAKRYAQTYPGEFDDLIAVAHVGAWKKLRTYDGTTMVSTWVLQGAKYAMMDHIRNHSCTHAEVTRTFWKMLKEEDAKVEARELVTSPLRAFLHMESLDAVNCEGDRIHDPVSHEPPFHRGVDNQEDVATALAKIPPKLRRVLWLHVVEGNSLREVGAMSGWSESWTCCLLRELSPRSLTGHADKGDVLRIIQRLRKVSAPPCT